MRFLAVFLTLLAALPARADWLRLRGTHTELLTDAGEKEGRRALSRLEQIRAILPGAERRQRPRAARGPVRFGEGVPRVRPQRDHRRACIRAAWNATIS